MKELFNFFSKMIYPALILFFIFAFTDAFVDGMFNLPLERASLFSALIFFLIFLIGFVGKIVLAFRRKE